jgi:hypothetical protein
MRCVVRVIVMTGLLLGGGTARAQTALAVSNTVVTPVEAVTATVTSFPGRHHAVIGSVTGAGFSFGGIGLRVGR